MEVPMKGTFMDFIEFLNENEELRKDVVAAASKHGFEFSDEVSDVELEAVAGGSSAEDQLAVIGEDAQLANVDMQNMLQKQQQTMQMMSQISKMLHDTSMAIIRKIG
jgi:hypothetical protein